LDGVPFTTIARISTGFGGRLRKGKRGRPVGTGSIRAGLGGVYTQISLDRGKRPLHQQNGEHYVTPVQHMLAGFANFDPPVEKKLAVGPDVPQFAVRWAH